MGFRNQPRKFRVAGQPTENLIFRSKNLKFLDNFDDNFNDLVLEGWLTCNETYTRCTYQILTYKLDLVGR